MEVLPAIIAESFDDLKEKMSSVEGLVALVQIDICDGRFVPSKSWPYIGDNAGDFQKILAESEGFPFWESMDFEADLMIAEPEKYAEDFIRAGAKRIAIHIESSNTILEFVQTLRKKYGYSHDSAVSVEIGIALNIETENSVLDEYLVPDAEGRVLIDFIQCMGIRKIGYQHQPFDADVVDKIRQIRKKYPDVIISVDGGVNFENARDLKEAGANRLISGSTLYQSGDIKEALEAMERI